MAPKVTSSSNRGKRSSAKPVTQGQNPQRANRQKVASKMITRSGAGAVGSPTGSGRTTYSEDRGLNKNTAKVTQGNGGGKGRPALPPGQRGGTPTKPSSSKPTPPRSNGGPVQPVRVRDMGKPSSALPSGGARGLLGPGGAPPKAVLDLLNKGQPALPGARKGGRVNMGGAGGALLLAAGGAAANYVGTKAGEAIGTGLRNASNSPKTGDNRSNRPGGRSAPSKPSQPASNYEKLFDTKGGRGNYGLDKPKPVAPLPASVRQSSSGSGSSTPSRGGSTSPARKAPAAPTPPSKPGQKFADFNPGRGTSKTNNPLMKDMIGRIKAREDAADKTSGPTKDGKEYGQYLQRQRERNDNAAGPIKDSKTYGDYLDRRKKKS